MKRWILWILIVVCLSGCGNSDSQIEKGLELRNNLLRSGCSFETKITANYGEETRTFTLSCTAHSDGSLDFTVQKPESIQGITGRLSAEGGQLTFDDSAIAFPMLADGELSPVSCPWIFINTLRAGYIRSCGKDGDMLRLTIDDSYEKEALQLDIWLNNLNVPQYVQIIWQGRSILSMEVSNFVFV